MSTIREEKNDVKFNYKCKKCNKKFFCKLCDSENGSVKFKYRTHCISGQLDIDFNRRPYHICDECFVPDDDIFVW
jgi:hypothetical protein